MCHCSVLTLTFVCRCSVSVPNAIHQPTSVLINRCQLTLSALEACNFVNKTEHDLTKISCIDHVRRYSEENQIGRQKPYFPRMTPLGGVLPIVIINLTGPNAKSQPSLKDIVVSEQCSTIYPSLSAITVCVSSDQSADAICFRKLGQYTTSA